MLNRHFLTWLIVNGLFVGAVCLLGRSSSTLLLQAQSDLITQVILATFLLLWLKNIADTAAFVRFFQSTVSLSSKVTVETDPPCLKYSIGGQAGRFLGRLEDKARNTEGTSTNYIELLVPLEERFIHQQSVVNVGSTLLITLGLIGTVAGLIQAMGGLESVTKSIGDAEGDLVAGMTTALGGMSTAFYTTLFGAVLGGFVLRILSLFSSRIVADAFFNMSNFCAVHIAPAFDRSPEVELARLHNESRHLAHDLRELLAGIGQATATMTHGHTHSAKLLDENHQRLSGVIEKQVEFSSQCMAGLRSLFQQMSQEAKRCAEEMHSAVEAGSCNASKLSVTLAALEDAIGRIDTSLSAIQTIAQSSSDDFVRKTNSLFKRLESRAVVSVLRDIKNKLSSTNGNGNACLFAGTGSD